MTGRCRVASVRLICRRRKIVLKRKRKNRAGMLNSQVDNDATEAENIVAAAKNVAEVVATQSAGVEKIKAIEIPAGILSSDNPAGTRDNGNSGVRGANAWYQGTSCNDKC